MYLICKPIVKGNSFQSQASCNTTRFTEETTLTNGGNNSIPDQFQDHCPKHRGSRGKQSLDGESQIQLNSGQAIPLEGHVSSDLTA